ncbi:MAG: hypothetical protein M3Z83_10525 [Actinomycetota bacterium]|nr:hypothetical protein [Actinomycetota bacterium]
MRRFVKTVAVALALAAAAGCGGGSSSKATAPTTLPAASGLQLLRKVALRDADLPPGAHFQLFPGGDTVVNQVTLDVCGADFPSESARTARLQQSTTGADRKRAVRNENVLYSSAPDAAAAFGEIRAAVAGCPARRLVRSKLAGVPPQRYDLHLVPDDQLGAVAPDHVALEGTITDQAGNSRAAAQVFQRRGLVMVGIYGPDLATIRPLLGVAATRLAGLSPAEVGT